MPFRVDTVSIFACPLVSGVYWITMGIVVDSTVIYLIKVYWLHFLAINLFCITCTIREANHFFSSNV